MKKYIRRASLVLASLTCLQVAILSGAHPVLAVPTATAQENLDKLLKTRSCRECDLAGLVFNRMDLSGVDLEGADLSSSTFYLANLAGANLRNTKLSGAVFGGADLGEADLRGADLEGASLDSAYLGETLIDDELNTSTPAKPAGAVESDHAASQTTNAPSALAVNEATPEMMNGVAKTPIPTPAPTAKNSLTHAKNDDYPEKTEVKGEHEEIKQDLSGDKLAVDQNNIDKAEVPGQQSTAENLQGLEVVEKEPQPEPTAEVIDSTAHESDRESVNALVGVGDSSEDLVVDNVKQKNMARFLDSKKCFGCDLSGLDFSGKNLKGADLEGADLSGCNLEKVKLDGANLKGASLQHANLRDASLKKADLYKADLTGADLTNAKVKGTMFDGAKTSGAIGLFSDPAVLMHQ